MGLSVALCAGWGPVGGGGQGPGRGARKGRGGRNALAGIRPCLMSIYGLGNQSMHLFWQIGTRAMLVCSWYTKGKHKPAVHLFVGTHEPHHSQADAAIQCDRLTSCL